MEVGFGAVGVGEEGFAEGEEDAFFVGSVGVGAVLEAGGDGGIALIDLDGDHGAELGGKEAAEGEGIAVQFGGICL